MNKEEFWRIIDEAREQGCGRLNMFEPLKERLAALDTADLLRWQQIFDLYEYRAYSENLWLAAATIQGGCSDDGFVYFRRWLIAQGKDAYMNALANPDSLADVKAVQTYSRERFIFMATGDTRLVEDVSFEEVSYAAYDVYETKMGVDEFSRKLEENPLTEDEKAAIDGEIVHSEKVEDERFPRDFFDRYDDLREKYAPRLYEMFDGCAKLREQERVRIMEEERSRKAEQTSVLAKIREGKTKPKQPRKQKSARRSYDEEH